MEGCALSRPIFLNGSLSSRQFPCSRLAMSRRFDQRRRKVINQETTNPGKERLDRLGSACASRADFGASPKCPEIASDLRLPTSLARRSLARRRLTSVLRFLINQQQLTDNSEEALRFRQHGLFLLASQIQSCIDFATNGPPLVERQLGSTEQRPRNAIEPPIYADGVPKGTRCLSHRRVIRKNLRN